MAKTSNIAPPASYHPPMPFAESKVSGAQIYLVGLLVAAVVVIAAAYFFAG